MIKETASSFLWVLLLFTIGVFLFILFIPYPLPVALRTLGSFLANVSILDLINTSMFQLFLISSVTVVFMVVVFWITTGNKKGNSFWFFLMIPNMNINQQNEVYNPFPTMVQLTNLMPYILLFLIFLIFLWRVFTFQRDTNRKGLL